MTHRKAIALLSGGLDSALAAKLILDQGIEVVGLHLESPFGCQLPVAEVALHLRIRLIMKAKGEAYLDLVKSPEYGYGRNMNPCVDCRIYMFELADRVLIEEKADFVVTGEVVGQRPMSQLRSSMELIDSRTSLKGRLLRPLSAKVLEPTIPEIEGWVEREKLLDISGRGRTWQMKLANDLKLESYSAPGGGCLLTEAKFSSRLRDFFGYDAQLDSKTRLAQSELLRIGRHFRIRDNLKVIVGRNQEENHQIAELWPQSQGALVHPESFKGPDAVAIGSCTACDRELIGRILMRYSKVDLNSDQRFRFESTSETGSFECRGTVEEHALAKWRL